MTSKEETRNHAPSPRQSEFVIRAIEIGLWCYLIILPLRLQFLVTNFIGIDSPFHARYASLFPSRIFARTFPTTAYSIWSTQWGDKEFLFHAYLAPFCQVEQYIQSGAKLASACLFAAVLCSLALILKRLRVPGALLWAALLPGLSLGWDYRMLMVRSHLASVLLILWILHCFEQRRMRPLVVLTIAYTWTYTAPYFALLMCALMAAGRYAIRITSKPDSADEPTSPAVRDGRLLLWCSAATVAGMLIHPQTPNQFLTDWLHLSLVTTHAWGVVKPIAAVGAEFQSETLREAYAMHPGVLLCLVVAWLLPIITPGICTNRTRLMLWMTVPAIGLYGLSGRFIEYLAPITVWALAMVISDYRRHGADALKGLSRKAVTGLAATVVTITLAIYVVDLARFSHDILYPDHVSTQQGAGKWLAEHAQPGDLVVPLDWTQFPSLYYYAPKQRYVVGLEPTTMEVVYPDKLRYLEDVRLGRRDLNLDEMRHQFPDARYVVLWSGSGAAAARILPQKRYTPVFSDQDDVVFEIGDSGAEH